MAISAWQTRWRSQPQSLRVVAWVVLASIAMVLTVPMWHGHAHGYAHGHVHGYAHGHVHAVVGEEHAFEDGGAGHSSEHGSDPAGPGDHEDSCPICMTVSAPMGDGLPTLPLFDVPGPGSPDLWLGAERAAVMWAGRDRASRGPPQV